ncbi:tetratricopeptide repeat protein, partial [Vibrio parahaemolyticus]
AADCTQASNLDLQIKACSIIIDDDRASEASLATAHMNRGTAYARKRRLKAAVEDLDAAAGIDPQNPLIFYNRGNIHLDLGNIADAIA